MRCSEAYKVLNGLKEGNLERVDKQTVGFLKEIGLVSSITGEQFRDYQMDLNAYRNLEAVVRRHESDWHQLFSRRTTLDREVVEIKLLESQPLYKRDVSELTLKDFPKAYPEEHRLGLPTYVQGEEMYFRITQDALYVLGLVSDVQIEDSDFQELLRAISISQKLLSEEGVSINETMVDSIPLVSKVLERPKNGYLSNSNYSAVESFFSSFVFEIAIPNLLSALKNRTLVHRVLVDREALGKVTYGGVEDRGNWKVQVDYDITYEADEYRNTYRDLSPIAEGAKKALETLQDRTKERFPEISETLKKYEKSRPRPRVETERENEREVSAVFLGRGDGR